jgi:hypothetical protein
MTAERIQALTEQFLRAENSEVADAVAVELQKAIKQYLAMVRVRFGDGLVPARLESIVTLDS